MDGVIWIGNCRRQRVAKDRGRFSEGDPMPGQVLRGLPRIPLELHAVTLRAATACPTPGRQLQGPPSTTAPRRKAKGHTLRPSSVQNSLLCTAAFFLIVQVEVSVVRGGGGPQRRAGSLPEEWLGTCPYAPSRAHSPCPAQLRSGRSAPRPLNSWGHRSRCSSPREDDRHPPCEGTIGLPQIRGGGSHRQRPPFHPRPAE